MAAFGKVHAQHRVAGLQQGEIHRQVGLGPGVGLHIGVVRPKEPAGPVPGDVFHLVHMDAAPVIPVGRVALRVFVGEHSAHSGHHRRGDDILRGDELQVAALAGQLPVHGGGNVRVAFSYEAYGIHQILVHAVPPEDKIEWYDYLIVQGKFQGCRERGQD